MSLQELLKKVRAAQVEFSSYPQEKVDEIFRMAATAANAARIALAQMAVEETGMGVFEDKVLKNHYASEYIYNRYSLQEGGKFNHDIRVTTLGRIARKYWMDELPMIINLLKGDMKLVGVRPISQHYFSLYSKELQEKRVHHKPGLLPPFYADMPKTLDEIEASEMRYLTMCEKRGTFATDFVYFWRICYTIVFKRARSH